MALAILVLLGAAVAGAAIVFGARREEELARRAEQQAARQEDQAKKAAADAKGQLLQADAERKTVASERDRALAAEQAARRSQQETQAILDFLKKKLLSAGRPGDMSLNEAFWAGGQAKDLTLQKAVDLAEPQVAESFIDRPMGEAAVRELLGLTYLNVGQSAQAVKQYQRALALREAMQGGENPETAACRNQLAVAYRLANRSDEAGRLFDRNPSSPAHAQALAVRGAVLLAQKDPADAELKLRESLAIRQRTQPDDWSTFDTQSLLGEALLEQKKFTEAEPLLLSGHQGLKQRRDSIPVQDRARLTGSLERLVRLYDAWPKQDKAETWRKELEAARAAKTP
jgi:hypothetical protein